MQYVRKSKVLSCSYLSSEINLAGQSSNTKHTSSMLSNKWEIKSV